MTATPLVAASAGNTGAAGRFGSKPLLDAGFFQDLVCQWPRQDRHSNWKLGGIDRTLPHFVTALALPIGPAAVRQQYRAQRGIEAAAHDSASGALASHFQMCSDSTQIVGLSCTNRLFQNVRIIATGQSAITGQ